MDIISKKVVVRIELTELEAFIKDKTGMTVHVQDVELLSFLSNASSTPTRALRVMSVLDEGEV